MFVDGYMKTELGSLTSIKTGKLDANASSENGIYPFFTCAVEPLKIDSYSYDCECVLVAGNGDLNVKYYNGKFDAYQRTYIIESKDKSKLTVPYLYYFLESYIETLRSQSIGGIIKYIKIGNLTNASIPILSIEKQNKIVKTLDKAKSIITHLRTQLEKLDLLVKARFVEMFGNPIANSMNWAQPELKECLESIDNGKSYICNTDSRVDNSPAILKLSAVTYGIYKPNENKSMIDKELFDKNIEVKDCDLLFTRKNTPELVGMSAYVFSTPQKLMMPDLIFRINTKTMCNKIYLWQLINHDLFRPCIQNIANGSAKSMSNISKERLSHLTIPLPPIELQTQFADFVKQVDQSKSILQQELDKAQMLFDSLMQEYFG